jgi:hypothetical protein
MGGGIDPRSSPSLGQPVVLMVALDAKAIPYRRRWPCLYELVWSAATPHVYIESSFGLVTVR